jgi:hypothetical protein
MLPFADSLTGRQLKYLKPDSLLGALWRDWLGDQSTAASHASRTPHRPWAAPLASYCGRKRRIARPYRLSPRRLTEKWTSNHSSQRTLGNRPSRRDVFMAVLSIVNP